MNVMKLTHNYKLIIYKTDKKKLYHRYLDIIEFILHLFLLILLDFDGIVSMLI